MIDWDHIEELRQEMGDAFPEIAEMFLAEVDAVIDRLRQAPSLDSMESDMHFLKGAALNFGFADMAAICASSEQLAAGGAPHQVPLDRVLETFDRSRAEFTARYFPVMG